MDLLKTSSQVCRATKWSKKLIGFGCDGTSVNIGDRGLAHRRTVSEGRSEGHTVLVN